MANRGELRDGGGGGNCPGVEGNITGIKMYNIIHTIDAHRCDARGERVVSANWISGVLNADNQKSRSDRRQSPLHLREHRSTTMTKAT